YVVLLPDATLADTRRRAEELAAEARKIHISHDGQSLGQVSLSIGVAVYPEHGLTGEALLRGADSALYRAKHEGRDRVHALA
ncbi:MAG: diguanylate cyclase, partial [Planctomycetes bacterium]|nr:diguanylate cyclase [Planctomycetota bacterium]